MKTITLTLLLIFLSNFVDSQTVESVIVEYEINHYGVKAKNILYLDDFGKKKVLDVYNPNKTTKRYLSKGGTDYTFMLENKTLNLKYPSVENDFIYHVFDMKTLANNEYYVNVEKTGTENILGKECDVYKISTADKQEVIFYIWESILLKKTSKPSNFIAVKIIENPKFDEGQFEIPEGYVFR